MRKQLGTPAEELEWWRRAAAALTAIAEEAGGHLPRGAGHPAMDNLTVDELLNRLYAGRAAADMAAGAFARICGHIPAPAEVPRPAPAVTAPPTGALVHTMPVDRGWAQ